MERFTKSETSLLTDMLMSMLKAMAKKFGVEVRLVQSSHTSSTVDVQLQFLILSDTGVPADFAAKARRVGVPADVWNKKFNWTSRSTRFLPETFTVNDIKPRNRKYPILATRDSDGKPFKFAVRHVLDNLVETP